MSARVVVWLIVALMHKTTTITAKMWVNVILIWRGTLSKTHSRTADGRTDHLESNSTVTFR